jgi:uncharacterized protein YdcH (DUF465 family)
MFVQQASRKQFEIERLRKEHRALDEQIIVIESRRWLTPAEESEIKRLKRLKLYKKDEIATLAMRSRA